MSEYGFPGATALGLIYKDGVMLVADRRASYGTFVLSKNARKIFRVSERIGIVSAGFISDMQTLVREARYNANMFRLHNNREMNARALAKFMSNALFSSRTAPLMTQTIVAGFDKGEKSVIVLDALGSLIEDRYTAVGSGSEVALGVLEADYKENMTYEEAKDLIVRTVKAALARDSASGNGIDLLVIDEKGTREEFISI